MCKGQNIFLTGFMGAGKTKVGLALSKKLGIKFLDTDDMIEEMEKRTIPEIFEEDGEGYFRDVEHDCVKKACSLSGAIVSLGGGAIVHQRNRAAISKSGISVYLSSSPETIVERVRDHDHRPLLSGLDEKGKLDKIRRMLEQREKFYRMADIIVESNDETSPGRKADQIIDRLSKKQKGQR